MDKELLNALVQHCIITTGATFALWFNEASRNGMKASEEPPELFVKDVQMLLENTASIAFLSGNYDSRESFLVEIEDQLWGDLRKAIVEIIPFQCDLDDFENFVKKVRITQPSNTEPTEQASDI